MGLPSRESAMCRSTAGQLVGGKLHFCIRALYAQLQSRFNRQTENSQMHDLVRSNILLLMAHRKIGHEKALAEAAGVEQSKLNRYMNGKIREPGLQFFAALATYFGVRLDDLVSPTMGARLAEPSASYEVDQRYATVLHAMEQLPAHLKDIVVTTAVALAETQKRSPPP